MTTHLSFICQLVYKPIHQNFSIEIEVLIPECLSVVSGRSVFRTASSVEIFTFVCEVSWIGGL